MSEHIRTLYKKVTSFGLVSTLVFSGMAVVIAFGSVSAAISLAFNQTAYATSAYSGEVSINITPITATSYSGNTTSLVSSNLDTTFTVSLAPAAPNIAAITGGVITFTDSGNACDVMGGGVNYNGHDTFFVEIGNCTDPVPGYVYLAGGTAVTDGSFQGKFISQASPVIQATDITISGPASIELGQTQQMTATVHPAGASQEVAWSVWTNPDGTGGNATIDSSTGNLTATGEGSITVIASVLNGPVFTKNYNVTVTPDATGPTAPVIVSPSNGDYFNSAPILNQWSPSYDVSGVDYYQIAYNYDDKHPFGSSTCPGEAIAGYTGFIGCRDVNGTSRNHQPGISEQGGVTIWVRAVDNIGNVGNWSNPVHYYYDATAPVAPTLVSPSDEAVVNGASVTQSWSTTDTDTDIDYYIYESYNDAGATSPRWHEEYSTTSKTATSVANSEYWWRVKAVDHAGNAGPWSDLWKITIDNDAPIVSIDSPTGSLFNTDVEVLGTVTDDNLRHYWVQVKRNGSVVYSKTVLSTGISNALLYTATLEGDYVVTLAARDTAGGGANTGNRSGDITKLFTIDKEAPTISSIVFTGTPSGTEISNGGYTKEQYFTFSLSSDSDTTRYQLKYWNNIEGSSFKKATPWNPPNLSSHSSSLGVYNDNFTQGEGTHYFAFSACDAAGNCSEYDEDNPFVITYDNTPPVVTVEAPATVAPGQQVTLTGTIDDPNATITVEIEGGEPCIVSAPFTDNGDGTWTWSCETTSPSPDGGYEVTVTTIDQAGNEGPDSTKTTTLSVETPTTSTVPSGGETGDDPVIATSTPLPITPLATGVATPGIAGGGEILGDQTEAEDVNGEGASDNVEVAGAADTDEDGTWTPFGLAWHWWLVILGAIAGLWWAIAAWRRRDQSAN